MANGIQINSEADKNYDRMVEYLDGFIMYIIHLSITRGGLSAKNTQKTQYYILFTNFGFFMVNILILAK